MISAEVRPVGDMISAEVRPVGDMISAKVRRVGKILRNALAGEGFSLRLPTYQRPYKWSVKSARTLLDDLLAASERGGEYRIGSVILHENKSEGSLDIVDGQQRIVTLVLIALALGMSEEERGVAEVLQFGASDTVSPVRIRENFRAIAERLRSVSEEERKRLRGLIRSCEGDASSDGDAYATVVVIRVKELSAAFRLFDSQNSRGKKVSPPALLKAYHLRAMSGAEKKELHDRVEKWEGVSPRDIDSLFEDRLYPVLLWTRKEDARRFTEKDIDEFKGYEDGCAYPCARRAAAASPRFLMTEPFRAGADFFAFTEKYLGLRKKAESTALDIIEKCIQECAKTVRQTECATSAENGDDADKTADKVSFLEARLFGGKGSAGLGHALELFYSAMMCYLDKFGEADLTAVAGRLFKWAMIPRISKQRLSAASVNKYVTETGVNVFALTAGARLHSEVRDVVTEIPDDKDITGSLAEEERKPLAALLRFMSEGSVCGECEARDGGEM